MLNERRRSLPGTTPLHVRAVTETLFVQLVERCWYLSLTRAETLGILLMLGYTDDDVSVTMKRINDITAATEGDYHLTVDVTA